MEEKDNMRERKKRERRKRQTDRQKQKDRDREDKNAAIPGLLYITNNPNRDNDTCLLGQSPNALSNLTSFASPFLLSS